MSSVGSVHASFPTPSSHQPSPVAPTNKDADGDTDGDKTKEAASVQASEGAATQSSANAHRGQTVNTTA